MNFVGVEPGLNSYWDAAVFDRQSSVVVASDRQSDAAVFAAFDRQLDAVVVVALLVAFAPAFDPVL